ncbi:MAG: YceI family protein [Ardenticatenaceae bacterium]|nr:YceI family protein [Ardenticatenaceae bacterium]
MKKGLWITVLLFWAVTLAGCFAFTEPEASTGAVVAPTLAPVVEAEPTDPASEPTEAPVAAATAVPEQETSTADPAIYEIDPARSEARFTIEEVLRGSDKTVVGVSSNLAGQIAFDMNDPAATQIGEILINARDFATDNNFRNRAIANEILLTNTHEFITFVPKELVGLPDSAVIGETYDFQIIGDLTIIGETREVTFDATVIPTSESELQGLASTTILYGDFGVTVPLSQAVSAVNEDVLLELDFVAVAQ